ncbi:MAG: hypothetical protein KDE01_14365, partial [Caldilineaceae bacterium]|nr:hypothetical protein [Caldilineaceae bacterium]
DTLLLRRLVDTELIPLFGGRVGHVHPLLAGGDDAVRPAGAALRRESFVECPLLSTQSAG